MSQAQNTALTQSKEKRKTARTQILEFIKSRGTANEYQIKEALNYNRSTIIGRLSELQDDGLIYVSGTFNGKHNSIYKYEHNEIQQVYNSLKRERERYYKWKKNGEKHNYFKRHQLLNKLK